MYFCKVKMDLQLINYINRKQMRRFILIIFLVQSAILMNVNASYGQSDSFELREGDILFQDLDCGSFCNAVEKVTRGYNGSKFSHVALVVKDKNGELAVIEAISKGVCLTPLHIFLAKSKDKNNNPKVMVGRLKSKYKLLIPKAIEEAYKLIGRPYDDVFCITNNDYYCSELIYAVFKTANKGKPLFYLYPMTFKDPETGKTFPAWIDYYKELNKPIPEGELGNGPGSISLSRKIQIVHLYGIPTGYKENKKK